MLNLLVETKNEYTTHLSNILTPLIFQGLQSIYNEAKNIVNKDGDPNMVLKIFQSCLKSIITWNTVTIDKATNAILTSSQSYDWLNDLIKATLKSNLIVLLYNPNCNNKQTTIDPSFYKSIKTTDFIHRVYIECARELWNNPYLLYHDYPPIEIKRNQRDCMVIIKEAIKESLRKLLPVKHILQIYLNEDIETNNGNDTFDKAISEVEENYLPKLINKDLNNNKINDDINNIDSDINNSKNILSSTSSIKSSMKSKSTKKINSDKSQGSRILDIIQNTLSSKESNLVTSPHNDSIVSLNNDTNIIFSSCKNKKDNDNINKKDNNIINNDNINKKDNNDNINKKDNNDNNINNKIIDTKIQKILNDLAVDSDIDATPTLSFQEYQEIFSNSLEVR